VLPETGSTLQKLRELRTAAPGVAERSLSLKFVIALSAPLTQDHPADPTVVARHRQDAAAILVVNELLVRGNLPAATREVFQKLSA
jgi:hypothetical protein